MAQKNKTCEKTYIHKEKKCVLTVLTVCSRDNSSLDRLDPALLRTHPNFQVNC